MNYEKITKSFTCYFQPLRGKQAPDAAVLQERGRADAAGDAAAARLLPAPPQRAVRLRAALQAARLPLQGGVGRRLRPMD